MLVKKSLGFLRNSLLHDPLYYKIQYNNNAVISHVLLKAAMCRTNTMGNVPQTPGLLSNNMSIKPRYQLKNNPDFPPLFPAKFKNTHQFHVCVSSSGAISQAANPPELDLDVRFAH